MKHILLMLCLFATTATLLSQSKDLAELQNKFWKSSNPKSKVATAPEKWKDESAVILFRDEFYKYTNNGKKMYNPSHFHQRVLLLDKAAVEAFSEFSFEKDERIGAVFVNWKRDATTVGIKVIKPNGEERIIDVDNEKVTQDEAYKIAIPNLEVGDILDIFIFEDDFLRSFSGTHIYDPVERVLSTKYPVLFSRTAVEVENDYFLNMESFNGAPRIKEEPTDKRSTRRYVLEANDLERANFPRWFYPFAEFPSLSFQVTFALKARNEYYAKVFLGDDDAKRKSDVTKEEIIDYYGNRFEASNRGSVRDVIKYLESKNITDKREQLIEGLYYIRHKSFNRFFEYFIARENDIVYYPEPCDDDYVILSEDTFVNYLAGLAKQLEIDYDIIVATADYNGTIDNLLLRSNVSYGLRFNFSEPLYLFEVTPHVQPSFFPYSLEGTKVFKLEVKKNRKIEEVSYDTMPMSSAADNTSSETVNLSFNEDLSKMNISRELAYTGHFKTENLSRRLVLRDFLTEEFDHYDTKHFYHCKKRQSKSDAAVEKKMDAVMDSYEKEKRKIIEQMVSENYEIPIEDYQYNLVNTARYSNEPLTITDRFVATNDLIKKAGPNYIFEIGRLIGGQVNLKEDELQRTENVYLNYAKTLHNKVVLEIHTYNKFVGKFLV